MIVAGARRLVREPLVQFLVIGGALFAIQTATGASAPAEAPPAEDRVVVSTGTLEALVQEEVARTGRRPSGEELRGLAEAWADDEVLYREAVRLGLDRGDPIVRRRLVQKMEFLSQDLAHVPEPDDAAIADWLAAHPDRFTTPGRLTVEHVFFARDRRGADAEADARVLALALAEGSAGAQGQGDPFIHGSRLASRTQAELAGLFGAAFAKEVTDGPAGAWFGPVASSYGWHVVRVTERRQERPATLEEARGRVRRLLVEQARDAANRETLARLRARYEVVVEALPEAGR